MTRAGAPSDTGGMGGLFRGVFKFAMGIVVIVGAFAGVMKLAFVDLAAVGHNGMAPTLERGDQVLLWRNSKPERGNVAICRHPAGAGFVMGRVIAEGGQEVAAERGTLMIDGRPKDIDWRGMEGFTDGAQALRMQRGVEDSGTGSHSIYVREGANFTVPTARVPGGRLFLLSDNRTYARRDSRSFGTVDPATCLGVVFMRWQPAPGSPNQLGSWLDIIR